MAELDDRIVRFTNITAEDFEHAYDGRPYFIKAGESKLFPYILGDHLAKHLAQRILLNRAPKNGQEDMKTYGPDDIDTLKSTIIKAVYDEAPEATPRSEGERMQRRVDALNDADKEDEQAAAAVSAPITIGNKVYNTKADIAEDLKKLNIPVDSRKTKAQLAEILRDAQASAAPMDEIPEAESHAPSRAEALARAQAESEE